ncbi:hypothetical protein [Bradyrhizobium liaoningense]
MMQDRVTIGASSGIFVARCRSRKLHRPKARGQVPRRTPDMLLTVAAILLGADHGSANASGKTSAMQKTAAGPARTTPGARDPKIAVAEEFELARNRGTTEALELFILRHPDDPLAERARHLIKQMGNQWNSR